MDKRTKAWIEFVFIAGFMIFVVFFKLYYLRADSGGLLVWNSNEAYLFATVAHRGVRVRLLEYPWVAFKEFVRAPPIPDDHLSSLTLFRITESGVERYPAKVSAQPGDIPDFFTPVGQVIYANCQGTVCKWVGDHFENGTLDEQKKFDGINHLAPDIDSSINGWSKRGVGAASADSQYSVEIGKQLTITVKQGNVYRSVTDSATVTLQRDHQPPQQLWHVDGQPRRVSKREYEKAFSVESN
jgi:hypothetical protein